MIRAAALSLLLCGCIPMSHVKVNDFPPLKVYEHHVSLAEMMRQCYPSIPLWMKALGSVPFACAWLRFEERRCDIYVVEGSGPEFLDHERQHCAGYDHAGSTGIADALAKWREQ